jgi:hypothetical protein
MTESTNRKPAARKPRGTTAAKPASKAPAPKRGAGGRGKPAQAPVEASTPPEQMAALRRGAATTRLAEADTALKALRAAVKADNAEAVREAADALAGAAAGTRRLWNTRKSGTAPRPRTVPGQGEYVVVVDGRIVKDSAYKPSVARDVAVAKKRIRDGEARPATDRYVGDEVMAQGKVMTRAEAAEAGVTP